LTADFTRKSANLVDKSTGREFLVGFSSCDIEEEAEETLDQTDILVCCLQVK
jgi:hypothetical protein